jgi:hypothetical protein
LEPRAHANENDSDLERGHDTVDPSSRAKGEVKDLREANENIRKAQGDEEFGTPVDAHRTGNKPRFDRDR